MINRTLAISLAIGTGLAASIALAGRCGPAAAAPAPSTPSAAPTVPAQAPAPAPASPTFPAGSRLGLVPPPGMQVSKVFPGFVDPAQHAVILVATLPAAAYADIQKTITPQALKKQGVRLEKQQPFALSFGKGVLVVGTQTAASDKTLYRKWLLAVPTGGMTALVTVQVPADNANYRDAVIRPALASLALRSNVPAEELLTQLPFKVGDLAGFRIINVIPGRAMLLVDAPPYPHMVATQGLPDFEYDGRLIIAAVPGGPSAGQTKADFARFAFGTIGGIKDVQVTMSEPVRLDEQEGFETVAHAKDANSGADLMVVQWLRFGVSQFLQVVGISRAPIWGRELARLRTLRDSIVLK
jgi:hypothetical protein